jgi:hypothetical protein
LGVALEKVKEALTLSGHAMLASSTFPVIRNGAAAMKAHSKWQSTSTHGSGWFTLLSTVTDPVSHCICSEERTQQGGDFRG